MLMYQGKNMVDESERATRFFWNSPWSPPSHIKPAKGYAARPMSSTNRDVAPAVAITL